MTLKSCRVPGYVLFNNSREDENVVMKDLGWSAAFFVPFSVLVPNLSPSETFQIPPVDTEQQTPLSP